MTNYLISPLETFFKEVSYFNGNIYIANSIINSRSEQTKSDFRVPQDLWQTVTYFRDVTMDTEADNLFPTGYGYNVGTPTLSEQSLRTVSFICCNAIVSVYEAFDSYLKDVLSQVYIHSGHKSSFKLKEEYSTAEDVRQNLWQVRSDRGFLKIIRRIAPIFSQFERKNLHNYDLGNWYNMIDLTRHQIIHNRQQASESFIDEIKRKNYWQLFLDNFSVRKADNQLIMITHHQASHLLINFLEYAYLIFKSFSQALNLPYQEEPLKYKPIMNVFEI